MNKAPGRVEEFFELRAWAGCRSKTLDTEIIERRQLLKMTRITVGVVGWSGKFFISSPGTNYQGSWSLAWCFLLCDYDPLSLLFGPIQTDALICCRVEQDLDVPSLCRSQQAPSCQGTFEKFLAVVEFVCPITSFASRNPMARNLWWWDTLLSLNFSKGVEGILLLHPEEEKQWHLRFASWCQVEVNNSKDAHHHRGLWGCQLPRKITAAGFPCLTYGKESACNAGDSREGNG